MVNIIILVLRFLPRTHSFPTCHFYIIPLPSFFPLFSTHPLHPHPYSGLCPRSLCLESVLLSCHCSLSSFLFFLPTFPSSSLVLTIGDGDLQTQILGGSPSIAQQRTPFLHIWESSGSSHTCTMGTLRMRLSTVLHYPLLQVQTGAPESRFQVKQH